MESAYNQLLGWGEEKTLNFLCVQIPKASPPPLAQWVTTPRIGVYPENGYDSDTYSQIQIYLNVKSEPQAMLSRDDVDVTTGRAVASLSWSDRESPEHPMHLCSNYAMTSAKDASEDNRSHHPFVPLRQLLAAVFAPRFPNLQNPDRCIPSSGLREGACAFHSSGQARSNQHWPLPSLTSALPAKSSCLILWKRETECKSSFHWTLSVHRATVGETPLNQCLFEGKQVHSLVWASLWKWGYHPCRAGGAPSFRGWRGM
jgi:hypothetical protein